MLSHRTAWLYYHAPDRPRFCEQLPKVPSSLAPSYPTMRLETLARSYLQAKGVEASQLGPVHCLVSRDCMRSSSPSVVSHRCSLELPPRSVHRLLPGMFVVSPELCFVQMAEVFADRRELVEFGYELCGGYELGEGEGGYRERPALTSVERIDETIAQLGGMHGIKTARWALRYVRAGARSPMETAHVMALVLPKRFGGLGIRSVRMDYRIDLPPDVRALTKKGYVVCDGYVPGARLDIEYNGFHHDENERKVADEERRNALETMGYRVRVLTKGAFFSTEAFRRHLEAVMRIVGIRRRDLPLGFWEKQEELRTFLLRRWL